LDRGHAKTRAEDDPHPVGRPEPAIVSDGLQRPIGSFQHHPRGIDARAFDELACGLTAQRDSQAQTGGLIDQLSPTASTIFPFG
jgi:hypothetical protein